MISFDKLKGVRRSLVAVTTVSAVVLSGGAVFAQAGSTVKADSSNTVKLNPAIKKVTFVMASEMSKDLSGPFLKNGLGSENSVSATFETFDDYKFGIAAVNTFSLAGVDKLQSDEKVKARDISFSLAKTYGSVLGTKETPVKFILNYPSSEDSQKSNLALGLGAEVKLAYEVDSHWTSTTVLKPYWGITGKADSPQRIKSALNSEMRYAHSDKASSYGFVTHKFKVNSDYKSKNQTKIADPGEKVEEPKKGIESSVVEYGAGFDYSPNSVVDLGVSLARA